ncbi:zincin-like metallopeptidase domain-containing protein [Francisellaceae bacterium CB52]
MKKSDKKNVAQLITNKIIDQLNNGIVPWRKEWSGVGAYNYVSGKPYSTLNQMLMIPGAYLTFNQVKSLGGAVKKGAKSSMVMFFSFYESKETSLDLENNEKETLQKRSVLKYFNVFHQNDIEGIDFKENAISIIEKPKNNNAEVIVDQYFASNTCGIDILFGSDKAFYSNSNDIVTMPDISQFNTPESYYATLFHEMTHSTGHESRLNRKFGDKFGDNQYAREELIAEIGSAILNSSAGINNDTVFTNSVAYISSWLKALNNDHRLIIYAACKAEKAAKFILGDYCLEEDLAA